jgi:hypothetical protein
MALKVMPSMQYGHRMTTGIGKCLGFGRLATLFRRQFDGVALVVHGVSLFINLAIFQVAELATNPTLRLRSEGILLRTSTANGTETTTDSSSLPFEALPSIESVTVRYNPPR